MLRYRIETEKGEDGYYVGTVPRLGVVSQGRTRRELRRNLKEMIHLVFDSIADDLYQFGEIKIKNGRIIPGKKRKYI